MKGTSPESVQERTRKAGRIAGPALAVVVWLLWRPALASLAGALPDRADSWTAAAVAGVALWMAIWWMTEAVAIPVTSLLPLVLLPVLAPAAFPVARVAAKYGAWQVFLFLGGFLIAIAMERSGLHRRVALTTIRAIGTRPRRIVLGFMVATAGLSMWISNTATTLMMLPIGMAVIDRFPERRRFAVALMLGIAYAASIGGVATPIGTPPNIAFRGIYAALYPQAPSIGFAQWMLFALPLVAVLLPAAWWLLVSGIAPDPEGAAGLLRQQMSRLGAMTLPERRVAVVFFATAAAWITRQPIALGAWRIPGWSDIPWLSGANDAVVAMAAGLALFILPDGEGSSLLDWRTAQNRTPWGILLLFGGGFALADAVGGSGLSHWIGGRFSFLAAMPVLVLVAVAATLLTFLTEITSNTATAQVMLPLAAAVATSTLNVHPLMIMLPVTIAASFAFMLPVATPPNAVVFGSGAVPMRAMVRFGLWLNLLGIVVLTVMTRWVAPWVFGIDLGAGLPPWAG